MASYGKAIALRLLQLSSTLLLFVEVSVLSPNHAEWCPPELAGVDFGLHVSQFSADQLLTGSRWFSLIRVWAPWLAPRHGKSKFELDKDAVLAAFVNSKGQHLVLLAISGINDVMAVFQSDESGNVKLHLRNDAEQGENGTVLAAIGYNFESANAAVMYQARNLVVASKKSTGEYDEEFKVLRDGVKAEWMENWHDGLGFCESRVVDAGLKCYVF